MATTVRAGSITPVLAQDRPICPRCDGPAHAGLLCEPCTVVSWAEAFRSLDDYTLAHRCPTCKAPPWTDCHAPGLVARRASRNALLAQVGGEPETYSEAPQHGTRQDAGHRHYLRDLGKAPWPEAREPGRCYSTIPPRPTADTDLNGADVGAPTPRLTTPSADDDEPPPFWRELI
jgi:hypothetical protein